MGEKGNNYNILIGIEKFYCSAANFVSNDFTNQSNTSSEPFIIGSANHIQVNRMGDNPPRLTKDARQVGANDQPPALNPFTLSQQNAIASNNMQTVPAQMPLGLNASANIFGFGELNSLYDTSIMPNSGLGMNSVSDGRAPQLRSVPRMFSEPEAAARAENTARRSSQNPSKLTSKADANLVRCRTVLDLPSLDLPAGYSKSSVLVSYYSRFSDNIV